MRHGGPRGLKYRACQQNEARETILTDSSVFLQNSNIAGCFFDFSRDVRNGMVTFLTISGKRLSEKAPKRKHSAADVLKKVKKTLHENAVRRSSPQPVIKKEQNGIHPAVPGGARRCPGVPGGMVAETWKRSPTNNA